MDAITTQFTHFISPDAISIFASQILDQFQESIYHSITEKDTKSITMIPSYNCTPSGSERGDYLAVDIGGSTLRIAIVSLDNQVATIVKSKALAILNNSKIINQEFFDWISTNIRLFLEEQSIFDSKSIIHTGLTWSFPIKQTSRNNALIQQISKGYTIIPEFENQDLKMLIEESCFRQNINICVESIINDSIAVYITGAYQDSSSKLALVLGTGVNSCVSINGSVIPSKDDYFAATNDHQSIVITNNTIASNTFINDKTIELKESILLNTELSIFGNNLLSISNTYDKIMDSRFSSSSNLKFHLNDSSEIFQPIELMTSGRYISELFRLIILDLVEENLIFGGKLPHSFNKKFSISGELLCKLSELTELDSIELLQSEFKHSKLEVTLADIKTIKETINILITRASFIISVSIISLIKLQNIPNTEKINISYVGSFLQHFKKYRGKIEYWLDLQYDLGLLPKCHLKFIEDSSIIGAAVSAAVNIGS